MPQRVVEAEQIFAVLAKNHLNIHFQKPAAAFCLIFIILINFQCHAMFLFAILSLDTFSMAKMKLRQGTLLRHFTTQHISLMLRPEL